MNKLLIASLCAGLLTTTTFNTANADDNHGVRGDDHAPIGVMGDHRHGKGEFMLSYRFMRMFMNGNRQGTDNVSPETIATTVSNPFAPPPTLRVVPTQMTTDMHMVGGMYAPTDNVTLMGMVSYINRDMDHITFQGMAGTTRLGTFNTRSKGLGDTKISSLIKIYEERNHKIHLNAGLSLPTADIKKTDTVLTPMNTTPTLRLPYAMQLGTGTYDILPGITYAGSNDKLGWGAQYSGRMHLGRNSQNYSRGDKHQLSVWGSYALVPATSVSLRVTGETESKIDGNDDQITAPVQTANPNNYGGKRLSTSLGFNTVFPTGTLKGHRFSVEATLPVYQDLNGTQLKRDKAIMLGWSKSF